MTRRSLVMIALGIAAIVFATGAYIYDQGAVDRGAQSSASAQDYLVRPHSPVIGPANAPVTIIEFFDPSCESCRAFYPFVKHIMAQYPKDVRLVIRYAPFHEGSDEAVSILEAARLQNIFVPVKEALLATQPNWAVHGAPNLNIAWEAARVAGLDIERARRDAQRPEIAEALAKDTADIKTAAVKATPTFFVNGKPLPSFGPKQLAELVRTEVEASRGASVK
ncbi:MAG: thioredoxin domain-containing protein [Hyphomicrobium sp.]|nr:thioredoxin domain-containing protein [Hyphomicrobium sp.]MBN9276152.1 thioredoxin domain-containing protein [Hyphomicrobium sp.]